MGVEQNDRPKVQLELQTNGQVKASWGPKTLHCGIFREDMKDNPTEVQIKEWWLYVGTVVNKKDPLHGSKPIFQESVGTKNEMMISKELLGQHKRIVAQVLGGFESETISGEKVIEGKPFIEGIYSDPVELEIK
jgi:hypothetical protein